MAEGRRQGAVKRLPELPRLPKIAKIENREGTTDIGGIGQKRRTGEAGVLSQSFMKCCDLGEILGHRFYC